MGNLSKMLEDESKTIRKNEQVGKRMDCTDLLISAKFEENHLHHILPNQNITDQIIFDLLSYITLNEENINLIIVKILTNYIEMNNKKEENFDEMVNLMEEIKNKLIESKEINQSKNIEDSKE